MKTLKRICLLTFIILLSSNLHSQNLLPEWHRKHQINEEMAISKAVGTYKNDSLNITVKLTENEGRLMGEIESPFSEGFLMFDEEKNSSIKVKYKNLAIHLVEGWINNNDYDIYDVTGGRWFNDSISTFNYVKYFKRTYKSLNNEQDSVKTYRVLGTYKRDQWDNHGYTNDGFSYGTYVEINTWSGKTKYMGIGWQNKRPNNAAGWRFGDLNTRFTRTKMIFEPRTPSKFIAFDAISDIKVGINFLPIGMSKKDYDKHNVTYCRIGNVRFNKVK